MVIVAMRIDEQGFVVDVDISIPTRWTVRSGGAGTLTSTRYALLFGRAGRYVVEAY